MSNTIIGHRFNYFHIQKLLLLIFLGIGVTPLSQAKELYSLLGIGYKHPYASLELPTAAVRYYTLPHVALDFFMGINTDEKKDYVGMGAQASYIFFTEQYAHMYFGVSGAYVSLKKEVTETSTQSSKAEKKSGFELTSLLGCELFLPHISSISFSIEMGLALTLIDSKNNLQTFARTPLKAGIFFYF